MTQLLLQQLATLKAAILAETDPEFVGYRTNGQTGLMAQWLNAEAVPTWYVWRTNTSTTDIAAVITFASFTPADAPDSTTLYTNRAMVCALKRDNIRTLLERATLPTALLNTRQSLTDALQNVPAGVGGASLDAGWLGAGKVKSVITRAVTRAERLFVTGTGTANTPGALTWEGPLSDATISAALSD